MELNLFGFKLSIGRNSTINENLNEESMYELNEDIQKENINNTIDRIISDNSQNEMLNESTVIGISEAVINNSPADIKKMIDSNEIKMGSLIDTLKSDYSAAETHREDEEMAKDTIIGSAMELMTDDCCMIDTTHNRIVFIESENKKLAEFLNTFLEKNIDIENRVWEWCFEIIKHGDFKLRRREYRTSGSKSVYYENVLENYKVSRIEYMGTILGFIDEEDGGTGILENKDVFVHFINSKLPNRKKVKLKVKNPDGTPGEIACFKVAGVSLVDNARYIYRIVNLLDNMLIMSRVARSTQYNVVKIEVGNASPAKTQEIISDVRRRIEGSTKMSKGKGMRTDPSPIPVNSNVYIPVRDGKGDINIESVNESIDVKSIVDIDYFRNKEFATIKTPKAYLGFEEELPGSLGNTSLAKLDIRYARTVQRGQNILKNGIKELCNNYLAYRGRPTDIDQFEVNMRSVTSAEDSTKIEEFMAHISVFDALSTLLSEFGDYVDKSKLLYYLLGIMGVNISDIASDKMMKLIKALENGEAPPVDKGEEEIPVDKGEEEIPPEEELPPEEEEEIPPKKPKNKNWGK